MNAIVSTAILSSRSIPQVIEQCDGSADISVSSQFWCQYDHSEAVLWSRWAPQGIPCFNIELLRDLERASQAIENHFATSPVLRPLQYIVVRSAIADVFNVGGDLGYFQRMIAAKDHAGLTEYGRIAVDVMYRNYIAHNLKDVTTIALLEGDALGGGLECALSCDIVVVEKHVKAGFPEVLFSMFPGMGGLSFLSRRTSRNTVNELTRTGRQYTAQELLELGVVDMVVESGRGAEAVRRLIRQRERQLDAHSAMNTVDHLLRPVSLSELNDVVRLWVDCAMRLTPRSLEWMRRLYQQQLNAFSTCARPKLIPSSAEALAA